MRVNETPNLDIPDNDLSVDRLERYLYREIEKFRKRVFGRIRKSELPGENTALLFHPP